MAQRQIPTFDRSPLTLFLDLDGVFADFDGGIKRVSGKHPHEISSSQLWKHVYRAHNFFLELKMLDGAHLLWEYAKQYSPTFLTGAPSSNTARAHKVAWVQDKDHVLHDGTFFSFGKNVPVIVLPRKDKSLYAGPTKVLVDDRRDNIDLWVDAGGIGVLHKDPWDTIEQLEELRKQHADKD